MISYPKASEELQHDSSCPRVVPDPPQQKTPSKCDERKLLDGPTSGGATRRWRWHLSSQSFT